MLLCSLHICVPELTLAKKQILSAFYGMILAKHPKSNENYDRFYVSGFTWTCRADGGLPVSRCGCPVTVRSLSSHGFLQRLNKLQLRISSLLSSAHFCHLLCTSCSTLWQCKNLHQEADRTRNSFFWVNLWLDQFPNIGNCRTTDLLKSIPGKRNE